MPLVLTVVALLGAVSSASAPSFSPTHLWPAWPSSRFVGTSAPCLRPHRSREADGLDLETVFIGGREPGTGE